MHIVHILRKYNPSEWGGTETALRQLCDGLRTLTEIEDEFIASLRAESDEARVALRQFLAKLVARGILEVQDAA